MKQHQYRISVEHVEDKQGQLVDHHVLSFTVGNHDDILEIVERIDSAQLFAGDDAVAFAVGIKLFSEVMLKHHDNPLFTDFRPHFMAFMKKLKASL